MKIPEEFEQLVRGIDPEGPKLESLESLRRRRLGIGMTMTSARCSHI
ncbi:MAG: hypothetical protein QOJ86_4017 [Bradyrhizobium sp.]|jgi:hypothetical protein|nr:hypothetical protein [Bradyrhizobium sp.]